MFRAEDYLMADGAASHTRQPVLTVRATLAETVPEILKSRTIPSFLDGMGSQIHCPSPGLIVKAAGEHHHIRSDISRPAGTLAGIDAVLVDID